VQKSVVITSGRSGSNLLVYGLLNAGYNIAPECLCSDMAQLEIFSDLLKPYGITDFPNKPITKKVREEITNEHYIEKILNKYDGTKFLYNHIIDYPDVLDYLYNRIDVKIIHLIRFDTLQQIFYQKIAEMNNVWHVKHKQERPEFKSVTVEYQELVDRDNYFISCRNTVNLWFPNAYTLTYNDLCINWEKETRNIQKYMGVKTPIKIPKVYKKSIIKPMKQLLTNYNELEEQCKGTEYEKFFF
jgi:LPS sulfotransferase NodH